MRKTLLRFTGWMAAALMTAVLIAGCHEDDDPGGPYVPEGDRIFMMKASQGNLAEMEAGRLAAQHGENAGVKDFGSMMVSHHGAAQTELRRLADSLWATIPLEPDTMHKAMTQMLMGMTGRTFDSAYIAGQVKDHQTTIALFQEEADHGGQPSVRQYAIRLLPQLQMHLQMADSLLKVVGML